MHLFILCMCVDTVEVKKTARVGSHPAPCGSWGTARLANYLDHLIIVVTTS